MFLGTFGVVSVDSLLLTRLTSGGSVSSRAIVNSEKIARKEAQRKGIDRENEDEIKSSRGGKG